MVGFPLPSSAPRCVDAVGDIRAHPTGDMGAIGMAGSPEQMIQTAVGGNRVGKPLYRAGGPGRHRKGLADPAHRRRPCPVASSPRAAIRLRASYVQASNAALGGISLALSLGEAIIAAEAKGASAAMIDAIVKDNRRARS